MKIAKRTTIPVGTYEENCSILDIGGKAWIVDPGSEADRIIQICGREKLVPEAILLTHAHFDHIGAIPALLRAFPGLPVYLGEGDEVMISHPMNSMEPFYPRIEKPASLRSAALLEEREGVQVIASAGHTPGGVCYYFKDDATLFSGDTLFAGSVGRTDFPGGDMAALTRSLAVLARLPDETTVVPGHGPETTIGAEKAYNPFIRALPDA